MNVPENMTLQDTLDSSGNRSATTDTASALSEWFAWFARIVVLVAIVVSPWWFGSVQYQAKFWLTVATLAGLAFWWFETAVNKKSTQVFPYVSFLLGLGILIGLLQLMPLPDFMLGRQVELYERYSVDAVVVANANADANAKPDVVSRATMDPEATWSHIQLLFLAIAGVLLGCRFFRTRRDIILLFSVCTLNGAAISFFGVVQKLTFDPANPKLFWMIELTNGGTPFGPYVNRNNCAGYLLMCLAAAIGLMLVMSGRGDDKGPQLIVSKEIPFWRQFNYYFLRFISELTATRLAIILGIILIATGVVSTLSRGGVLALLAGGIVTLGTYAIARKASYAGLVFIPLVAMVIAFSAWVGFGDQLIDRFQNKTALQSDSRLVQWQETFPAASEMGLLGSGLGSYKNVHRLYRDSRELGVFDYAENQYFQALIEAGWAGLLIFLAAWLVCAHYSLVLLFRGTSLSTIAPGVLGVFLLSSQAVASFFDFGFYIPANLFLMSVLTGFLAFHAHSLSGRLKKKNWLSFQLPNYFIQVVLLIVFAGVSFTSLDYYRRWALDDLMNVDLQEVTSETMSIEETENKIRQVSTMLGKVSSVDGVNYLGELWLLRSRLQLFEKTVSLEQFKVLQEPDRTVTKNRLWLFTNPSRIQEEASRIDRTESEYAARAYLNSDFVSENYPKAMFYYKMSRSMSPLQPQVHTRLARLNSMIGSERLAELDMVRAVELAPCSEEYNRIASIFFLQVENPQRAAPYFKRQLELDPRKFNDVMKIVTARSGRQIQPVKDLTIYNDIIPESPELLYQFATSHLAKGSPLRLEILEKADQLLGVASKSDRDEMLLSADIKLAKDDIEGGLEQLDLALTSNPRDHETRLRLAGLLFNNGDLEGAKVHADILLELNRRKEEYIKFADRVDKALEEKEELDKQRRMGQSEAGSAP